MSRILDFTLENLGTSDNLFLQDDSDFGFFLNNNSLSSTFNNFLNSQASLFHLTGLCSGLLDDLNGFDAFNNLFAANNFDNGFAWLPSNLLTTVDINASSTNFAGTSVSNLLVEAFGNASVGHGNIVNRANRLEGSAQTFVFTFIISVPFRNTFSSGRNVRNITLALFNNLGVQASSNTLVRIGDTTVSADRLILEGAATFDASTTAVTFENFPDLTFGTSAWLRGTFAVKAFGKIASLGLPEVRESVGANVFDAFAETESGVVGPSSRTFVFFADTLFLDHLVTLGTDRRSTDTAKTVDKSPATFLRAFQFTDATIRTLLNPTLRAFEYFDFFFFMDTSILDFLEALGTLGINDDVNEDNVQTSFVINTEPASRTDTLVFNDLKTLVLGDLFVTFRAFGTFKRLLDEDGNVNVYDAGSPLNSWLANHSDFASVATFLGNDGDRSRWTCRDSLLSLDNKYNGKEYKK